MFAIICSSSRTFYGGRGERMLDSYQGEDEDIFLVIIIFGGCSHLEKRQDENQRDFLHRVKLLS